MNNSGRLKAIKEMIEQKAPEVKNIKQIQFNNLLFSITNGLHSKIEDNLKKGITSGDFIVYTDNMFDLTQLSEEIEQELQDVLYVKIYYFYPEPPSSKLQVKVEWRIKNHLL